MIRTLMLVSAFALAAPAFAQDTQPPQEPATESTATQPPAEAQTMPESTTPSTTTTPSPAQNQPAPANSANTVAAVVDNDFPAFDTDKDGELSKEEFAAWMTKLRAAQPNASATTTDTAAWTDAAFAQADTDKSKSISKGELTAFLQG